MNVFERAMTSIEDDMIIEMAVLQISNKDFLNLIKKGDYKKALEAYTKSGGAIGGRAQPRRTMTAWRGYVAKKDPRYEGITDDDIDKFEELLMAAHSARKEEEKSGKSLDKEPEPVKEAEPEVEKKNAIKDEIKKNAQGYEKAPTGEGINAPDKKAEGEGLWAQVNAKLREYNFTGLEKDRLPSFEVTARKFGDMDEDKKKEAYRDLLKLNQSYHHDVAPAITGNQKSFYASSHVKQILQHLIDAEGKKVEAIKTGLTNPFADKVVEKAQAATGFATALASAKEKVKTDKKFGVYIASFPKAILQKFLPELVKDYDNGYEVPAEYRDDADWIKNSMTMFNPHGGKKELQAHRVADYQGTREAREKVKLRELKSKSIEDRDTEKISSIKGRRPTGDEAEDADLDTAEKDIKKSKLGNVSATRKGTASIYDKYGYPKENKEAPENERQIKELIKKASSESPGLNDIPEVKEQKEKRVVSYVEKILALKKIHVLKTENGMVAKMPDKDDELYPLAMAFKKYKEGGSAENLRHLLVQTVKRIGTHSPEVVRNNAIKRLDDEMSVGLAELNNLAKEDNIEKLKEIGSDIVSMYDYTKARKPSLRDFREKFGADDNTFEAYSNIDYLYKVKYGIIKDATAQDIKNRIVAIKKSGLGNLVDLKAAGEKPAKAMDTWERDNKALSAKIK